MSKLKLVDVTVLFQLVYTTMEKHFVELKQELFDMKLHVVTLNSTLVSMILNPSFIDNSDVKDG